MRLSGFGVDSEEMKMVRASTAGTRDAPPGSRPVTAAASGIAAMTQTAPLDENVLD